MRASNCSNCFYEEVDDFAEGTCHRYPPLSTNDNGVPVFPDIFSDSWCGEWRANAINCINLGGK